MNVLALRVSIVKNIFQEQKNDPGYVKSWKETIEVPCESIQKILIQMTER